QLPLSATTTGSWQSGLAVRRGLRRPLRRSPYSWISPESEDRAHARREKLGRIPDSLEIRFAVGRHVALAEAREAPIITCDGPLADAPGHRARIEVLD